jgi:hypothetical protein
MTLTTRLAIAMIALVAIAVTAVGWLSYRNLEQAILPRVLDRIETHSRLLPTNSNPMCAACAATLRPSMVWRRWQG